MNIYLIERYINKLQEKDIKEFLNKEKITIENKDITTILNYMKSNCKKLLTISIEDITKDLKNKVSKNTISNINYLYKKYEQTIKILREG